MHIPTITVIRKSDGAECVINQKDFDAARYSLPGAKPQPEIDVEDIPAAPTTKKTTSRKSSKK